MLITAALASAEKIINTALRYDPATRLKLARLSGKILAVNITAPVAINLFVMPLDEEIELMANWDGEVDTQLSGSLMALLQLSTTEIHNLKYSGVTAMGDLTLLADLQQLLKHLDIDWEDMLSQFTGDIIGHQTAQIIRAKFGWAKDRAQTAARLGKEFLTEEYQALVSKPELDDFHQQVDELRLAVDRAAARVEKLLAERKP
ncbi:hypothetical protein D0C16_18415 [Cellvibrio sp. KY-GH-1]|uniref:ubiquinone biosynthesis accessory factor UbiJ n=1 Tax=Cellvibrio sp. KY-GH-1 TaxID=2303332 RepID=UPI0012453110|nr:SCP2 sterol-binding domain-containing protein [Cellvibrio sp. KY-GH-1]QEY17792.1 hypothetical protein D0C16_18415 [Cellvibrio sp. KY-GH-1]